MKVNKINEYEGNKVKQQGDTKEKYYNQSIVYEMKFYPNENLNGS